MEDTLRARLVAAHLARWLDDEPASDAPAHATPLDALAERLGLDVELFHPATHRPGLLGYLEPDENLIFLRAGLPDPIRRFTLAHEIGHAVLHRARLPTLPSALAALLGAGPATGEAEGGGCDGEDLDAPLETLGDETLRPGQAYSARARRESEANAFAAALLLPAAKTLALYHKSSLSARSLGQRFGVSEDVMLRRLTALLTPQPADTLAGVAPVAAAGPASSGGDPLDQLDPWQRAAATSPAPALVIAGPGAGKTSTLVGRIAALVRQQGVAPDAILALTFSNKAAREMSERIEALLAISTDDPAESGTRPRARPTVSTIHAFCGDLLRRYAPRVGLRPDFRLVGETEGYFLLRRLAGEMRELTLDYYQPLGAPALHFPALLNAISRAKDELADPQRYLAVAEAMAERAATPQEREAAARAREVAAVYRAYQQALEARGDADFGDLIRLAVRLLREHPDALAETRQRFQGIVVDEFQDINRAMGALLQTLAGADGPLWAVGDADQAIYRFRGASPANLAQFAERYPGAQVHTLRRNYRSRAPVLAAAAAVASAFLDGPVGARREPLEAVRGGNGAAGVVTLAVAPDEASELDGLAREIRSRQAAGRSLAEQVVLCRTRRGCQRVAEALGAAGISARLLLPLLEQDEIKDALGVVALLADPSGAGLLRAGRIPDHPFTHAEARALLGAARERGVAPVTLLAEGATERDDARGVPGVSPAGAEGMLRLGAALAEMSAAPDVATAFGRYIFSYTALGRRLLADATREADDAARARAAHMAQLLLLARAFDDQRRAELAAAPRDGADATPRADWAGFLDYARVVLALRQQVGAPTDDAAPSAEGVRILTVHASKGLEFPVVYLPGLADRRFPTQRRGEVAPLPAGLSEDETLEARDPNAHLAEEACLFYVALTRARDELILSYAERYGRMRYRPSPFLAPLDEALGATLERRRWARETAGEATATERQVEDALGDEIAPFPLDAPLRPAAIETYARCPRQFAYRYVYGLRPREIGLATLRRSLHETLQTLHERFLTERQRQGAGDEARDAGESDESDESEQALTLAEAQTLFERQWLAALNEAAAEGQGEAVESAAYQELYRQHGLRAVARAWSRLARVSAPSLFEPDVAAEAPEQAEPVDAVDGVDARAQFDARTQVRVGRYDIALTLDRVDSVEAPVHPARHPTQVGASGASGANGAGAAVTQAPADATPVRFVRHRLGKSATAQSDMRTLLYTLAAEAAQQRGAPVEMYQHNLTTGELEPIRLNARTRDRLREELTETLDGMREGVYPPRPEPAQCQSCPFLLICPT